MWLSDSAPVQEIRFGQAERVRQEFRADLFDAHGPKQHGEAVLRLHSRHGPLQEKRHVRSFFRRVQLNGKLEFRGQFHRISGHRQTIK
jgi:hypothetical protein